MSDRVIIRRILHRTDTAENWQATNPVLHDGEFGIERQSRQFKIGDGITPWNDLDYAGLRGPPGPAGFISEDEGNRLRYGSDGGFFVPELTVDLVELYSNSKES
jgi:hypothetical protein